MNTALLAKKALKLAEATMKESIGLDKPFNNRAIESTDILVDAVTSSVDIEQTYRRQFKIKKNVYVVSVELNLNILGADGKDAENGPQFSWNFEPQLTKFDEFDEEIPVDHNFKLVEGSTGGIVAFVNNLAKFKAKSLDDVRF